MFKQASQPSAVVTTREDKALDISKALLPSTSRWDMTANIADFECSEKKVSIHIFRKIDDCPKSHVTFKVEGIYE
jgi:hypothetical protein